MAKYPGDFILNEVGTRKELANIYGVSERTIYRWLNKAADESGIKPRTKARRPRLSTLEKFTGTRKQLAKKYGVSERTAYRWLKKARDAGADIPKRQRKSKYPGPSILADQRTAKQIAEDLEVTPQTVRRWKRRAKLETLHEPEQPEPQQPQDTTPPLEDVGEPWEVPEPDEDIGEPWEVPPPEEDIGEPWEVPESEYEYQEEYADQFGVEESLFNNLADIAALLQDVELIPPESKFWDLEPWKRLIYLSDYISYQADKHPKKFYDVVREWGYIPYENPELIAMVNIWGEDFNFWLEEQIDIDNY